MTKPFSFLQEVRAELEKVVWPTRDQVIRYSILVIVVAVVTGLVLGGLDYGLTRLTEVILVKYGR